MKIAIFHDDFSICGGGEKLVALLAKCLNECGQEADIITYDVSEETRKIIPEKTRIIRLNTADYPTEDSIKRLLFSKVDVSADYDFFVFSGHSCLCASRKHKPNLLYCHKSPRSDPVITSTAGDGKNLTSQAINSSFIERSWERLYCLKNAITPKPLPEFVSRKVDAVRVILAYSFTLRDLIYLLYQPTHRDNLRNVEKVIVNSSHIREKANVFYERDAAVIYPPVETGKYFYRKPENYWISINRITPLKRIELQLLAFEQLPDERLLIVGDWENKRYFEMLQTMKPDNVEFAGVLPEKELIEKTAASKGGLFTALDEDFGMAPVEIMAAGKAVIVPREGGCVETVLDGKTGLLLDGITPEKIVEAVKEINRNPTKYNSDSCIRQARKFDVRIFIEQMKRQILH